MKTYILLVLVSLFGLNSNGQQIFKNEYSRYFIKFEVEKKSVPDSLYIPSFQFSNQRSFFKLETENLAINFLSLETNKINMHQSSSLRFYPSSEISTFFSSFKPTKRCLIFYDFNKSKKN